jgi:pimeloyl-ACP methyl ester carboxylesterase
VTDRELIAMPDGRNVEILTAGAEDGLPLVVHEGTPIGLELHPPTVEAARRRGLRVVQIARPGYERSTPLPGRAVADIGGDTRVVMDHLGAETFVTAGWSGGGPHALACAAVLSGRCLGAASVAGVAPYRVEGLDWTAGMAPENVAEFGAALRGREALTEFLEPVADGLRSVTGPDVAASFGELASAVDVAALTGEYAETMASGLSAAVAYGIAGWRDDDLAFVADWGFSLGWSGLDEILTDDAPAPAPVAIWQGDQDRMVPFDHGVWLADHIPGARRHLLKGEGHLTLTVGSIDRILDDLLDLAGVLLRPPPSMVASTRPSM